jgi:hypothetical protein
VAAPGLIARVTVCLWSGRVTHGRVINRMSDNTQEVCVEGGYCAYDECLRFVGN